MTQEGKRYQCVVAKRGVVPGRLPISPARTNVVLVIPRTVRPFVGEAPPTLLFSFYCNTASVGGMGVEVLAIAGSWQREGDGPPRHHSVGPIRWRGQQ